jgi:BirA family biotin operon repressor/biotin-[acetyl-CoA-carboxylase] ligase
MKLKKFNFKIINSTNDRAFQIIKKTNNKSGIVIAEKQKRGRGQYGKNGPHSREIYLLVFFSKLTWFNYH